MKKSDTINENVELITDTKNSSSDTEVNKRKITHSKLMHLSRYFDLLDGTTPSYVLGYN